MAKKRSKDEQRLDYNAEIRLLREQGPKNLYLLYGPEDYLREQYVTELKKRCLREETAERVNHHSFMVLINMIRAFLWEGESRSQH